jgi:DNA repair photolyase
MMSDQSWSGRGTLSNPDGRFEAQRRGPMDADAWDWSSEEENRRPRTTVGVDEARSVISTNDSPDVPFERSVNPYRGCEHGCIYCFARPSHAYLGLSSGLDFETKLFAKPRASELLRAELARLSYRCEALALGANTDPYQPVERHERVTRGILEVLVEARNPVGIVTKSRGVLRDLDLLVELARERLVHVYVSVTTLDADLARRLEPRASSPARRLDAIESLAAAGVPVGVLVSPLIPGLNDHDIEGVLAAARARGATRAGSLLVRLPHEVKDLFVEWLEQHYPERRARVLALLRECVNGTSSKSGPHGERLYNPTFGARMRGVGPYAALLRQRFELARSRLGFAREPYPFDVSRFRRPAPGPGEAAPSARPARQLPLFR